MPGGVQVGVGYIDIKPDMSGFGRDVKAGISRDLSQAGDVGAKSMKSSLAGVVSFATTAFAGVQIKNFFSDAIQSASDLAESASKSDNVFKSSAGVIQSWAETGAKSFGLSKQASLEAASTFGNMFAQLGLGSTQAAGMSTRIVELAADFASFHNADITEVILAQSAAFRGEYDALQRFLPLINAATVEQKALEQTGKKTTKELTAQDKALAVNTLMIEGAGDAAGDFARTADGLANSQRSLTAEWANAKTELGESLAPIMRDVVGFLKDEMIPAFQDLFSSQGDAQSFWSRFRDNLGDMFGFIVGAFQQFGQGLATVIEAIPGGWGEDFADELRAGAEGLDVYRDQFHRSKAEIQSMAADQQHAAIITALHTDTVKGATAAVGQYTKGVEVSADKQEDLAAAVDKTTRSLASARRSLADAQRGETVAQQEYDEAVAAAEALGGLDSAQEEVAEKAESLKDAQDRVADAHDSVADAADTNTKALDKIADAQDRIVAGNVAVLSAFDQTIAKLTDLGVKAEEVAPLLATVTAADAYLNMSGVPNYGAPLAAVPNTGLLGLNPLGGVGPSPINPLTLAPAPGPTTTNYIDVTIAEPNVDPLAVGKAIAWAL